MPDILSENKLQTKSCIFSVQDSFYMAKSEFESYKKKYFWSISGY